MFGSNQPAARTEVVGELRPDLKAALRVALAAMLVMAAIVLFTGYRGGECAVLAQSHEAREPLNPENLPYVPTNDEDIKQVLRTRIAARKAVGLVVGIVDKSGGRILSIGRLDQKGPVSPNENTVYEIGSITKIFTSLLLTEMIQKSEVGLEDPVQKYLPKSVHMPTHNGKEIRLVDLATHTSGLPGMPSNSRPKNKKNPYADYTVQDMYAFLNKYELTRDPGEKYEYSNFGAALLGHVLARRAKMDYPKLLRKRVLEPLRMNDTDIALTPGMAERLAPPHNESLRPGTNWSLPAFEAAGALHSTAHDLLLFLSAELGYTRSPLGAAMRFQTNVVRRPADARNEVALGWHIQNIFGDPILWHNGGTGGYHAFVGFSPTRGIGVVVLNNSPNDIDDIGFHVLDSRYPVH